MDSFNYCVQCNPEENWLELEFRSENDEPIDGLLVTITNQSAPLTHTRKPQVRVRCCLARLRLGNGVLL